ncbi:ubiquinone biosynthesis protein [Haloactinopolyspora alba]|uniref:Ubiquinone biosynthesis protein n=1 Tax=Haloactinopolyspora alba TaxID=648780 RepID=A0A2P8DVS4_9ACTN|nr:AarF/UbiB family protein [Haloactinopolyspora alba]PSL01319.1 ubiquinone biosynthesis protein [Haloactinopolyspora alba]
MHLLTLPFALAFGLGVALLIGLAAQRLLGVRLGLFRLLLTGVFAMSVGPLIVYAMLTEFVAPADELTRQNGSTAFWFVLLAAVCTILSSMAFLVIIEAFVPLGSIPPALVWGRGLLGRLKRSRRYWQIVGIAMRHGLGSYVRGTRDRALDVPSGRAQLGRSLATTMNAGGVTFVKIGQILATRRDLLPAEVAAELAKLQDQATPVPWPDVRAVVEAELGAPVDQVFAEFDPQPLGAASVGQVHAARLRTGAEVVVKVQRPGIRPVVERDLDIAARLASRLETGTRWGRRVGVRSLAAGLATAVREELDYRIEADNITAIAGSTTRAEGVVLPEPHLALCTERVLVMDRVDGVPLTKAAAVVTEHDLDREQLATTLLDCLMRQIILDGVFHADPHGGNIVLLDDGRLGLLDFGSVGRLDGALREALQRLLLGVDHSDPLAVSDALLELVPRPDEIDQQELERDLGRFMARHTSGTLTSSARMFGDLFRVVADHGLAVPPEIAAVFRTLATAEGTISTVAPEFDLFTSARRLASGYVDEQYGPENLRNAASEELVALLPILRRLPRRVERIASAAEHGRLGMNVRLLADDRDRSFLRDMLHEVLLTFLAATTGIMSAMLLGTAGGPMVTDSVSLYELIGYNMLVISAILALRVLAQIFRRGPRHD